MRIASPRRRWLMSGLLGLSGLVWAVRGVLPEVEGVGNWSSPPVEQARRDLGLALSAAEPGWSLKVLQELPEPVNALTAASVDSGVQLGTLFAGTSPAGAVYKLNVLGPPGIVATIATGLGEQYNFGTCCVNRLALRDLDRDGRAELLASTSQVAPRGRPRLYAWSLEGGRAMPRGVARPDIASSWSHGLALIPRADGQGDRAFLTFCGFGEIVEYRLEGREDNEGYHHDALGWKQVGQLDGASGEWAEAADVDNDGSPELCIAAGFGEGKAAIEVYVPTQPGPGLVHALTIDEGHRFGNVRFLVGDLGEGVNEVIAWWITDHILGGDCEVIRYRLGPDGVEHREVIGRGEAGALWPDDHQSVVADLDGDGRPEVWFATKGGDLYRYDPDGTAAPHKVLHLEGGIGPITAGIVPNAKLPSMFIGWGRRVVRMSHTG